MGERKKLSVMPTPRRRKTMTRVTGRKVRGEECALSHKTGTLQFYWCLDPDLKDNNRGSHLTCFCSAKMFLDGNKNEIYFHSVKKKKKKKNFFPPKKKKKKKKKK